jgi:hypothetical protein
MADLIAKVSFSDFIVRAEQYQLPVGFLRTISRSSYTFSYGDSAYVSPWTNRMVLELSTLELGRDMAPSLPMGEAPAVQTLYHESTHAWLDLQEDTPKVVKLVEEGETYYKDAPLTGGQKADDPERVFQEAMASYVGHRAATYWSALESLTLAEDMAKEPEKLEPKKRAMLLKIVREARARYGREMGLRVFGYQNTPGWFNFSSDQVETTKVISSAMKNFCDRELLEGMIPDQFERKKTLTDLWAKLRAKFYPDL